MQMSNCLRAANVIGSKLSLKQATAPSSGALRLNVGRFQMPCQAFMIGPKFREADKAGIKGVFSHVICDAAVSAVRGFN